MICTGAWQNHRNGLWKKGPGSAQGLSICLGWDSHTLQQTEMAYLVFPHSFLHHWTQYMNPFYSSLYSKINKRKREPSRSLSCPVLSLMMMRPSPRQWLLRLSRSCCPIPSKIPQIPTSSLAPQLPNSTVLIPLYATALLVLGIYVLPKLSKHGSGETLSVRHHRARGHRLPMHCTPNCCQLIQWQMETKHLPKPSFTCHWRAWSLF